MEKGQAEGTILVVDDEPGIVKYVEDILLATGWNFLSAPGGEEALQTAESGKDGIDLLLTDVNMPGMDGLELARRFQRTHPETKIVFMSGIVMEDEIDTEMGGQGVFFLPKPFTPEELTGMLNDLLGSD